MSTKPPIPFDPRKKAPPSQLHQLPDSKYQLVCECGCDFSAQFVRMYRAPTQVIGQFQIFIEQIAVCGGCHKELKADIMKTKEELEKEKGN